MNKQFLPTIVIGLLIALSLIGIRQPDLIVRAQTSTIILKPVADSYVSQSDSSTSFGTGTSLQVDTSPTVNSYLRFNVTGLNGGSISNARLRIFATRSSATGYSIHPVADNAWNETQLTYQNAPAIGTLIGKTNGFKRNQWTEVDVSSYINKEGLLSLALGGINKNGISLASRESTNPPQLYLTIVFAGSPSTTASPTQPPTSTPSPINPTATPKPTISPTNTPVPTSSPTPGGQPGVTNNFYVDNTLGSDSNTGMSTAQPWKTIQKCADTLSPGGICNVKGGNYPERVHMNRSGQDKAPITFRASGSATMNGFTINANYVTVTGFDISNTPNDSVDGWGIYVKGSHCNIEGNYIHFATRGGIDLFAANGQYAGTSNCVVRNNRLYRNGMMGIEIRGQNNLIEGNEVWGTIQHHPNWANPPSWADADGIRYFGSGHLIRKNYVHDILYGIPENINPHIDCFQTFSNADYEAAQNVVLEGNLCKNAQAQAQSEFGKGFMLEGASHIIIRNNIVSAFNHVNVHGDSDITIVNNTFIADIKLVKSYDTNGIYLENAPNITVQNNIFYNLPNHVLYIFDSASRQGLNVGYNDVYRSDGQSLWNAPYPHDLWGIDPKFVDASTGNYHLQAISPAIDKGNSSIGVNDDYDGNSRLQGSGIDIGALEYLVH